MRNMVMQRPEMFVLGVHLQVQCITKIILVASCRDFSVGQKVVCTELKDISGHQKITHSLVLIWEKCC